MKICVLTGKRGGFGAMRPMLRAMRDDPFFELDLVACDMHANKMSGGSLNEITEDFRVSVIPSTEIHVDNLGKIATYFSMYWEDAKPDLLMLYGDRGESLAAAMIATELCIPIAHLQGGDISGTMDDRRRDAITALSDLHFVSHKEASYRVVATLGSSANVYIVGDSHIDPILFNDYDDAASVAEHLSLDPSQQIVIVLHHPDPTDRIDGGRYISNIMDAIDDGIERQIVMIYPCSDPGWKDVVRAIDWYRGHPNIQIHKNLPSRTFLGLMAIADCIVGNSSCGIIEAPYLGLPAVNVGHRQDGRLCSDNIYHATHEVYSIEDAFFRATHEVRPPYKQLYGTGNTGDAIIRYLKEWYSE